MSFALQNNEDALGQVKGLSIHLRPHKSRSRRWLVDHNWNILEALVLWTPSCLATLKFHVFAYSVVSEGLLTLTLHCCHQLWWIWALSLLMLNWQTLKYLEALNRYSAVGQEWQYEGSYHSLAEIQNKILFFPLKLKSHIRKWIFIEPFASYQYIASQFLIHTSIPAVW